VSTVRHSPQRIAEMLRSLSLDMGAIANMMGRYGGEAEWSKHSAELRGAASMARQWADEIEEQR
jgi:hypothetical protein